MKRLLLQIILLVGCMHAFAMADSVVVPFQRQRFHDKITEEQVKCDKEDGKKDNFL